MSETIGTAYIQIEPSAEGISGKLSQAIEPEATKVGKSAGSKLSSALGTATKIGGIAVAGLTTAIAGTTTATINAAKGVSEYGDNIDKTAQKLGLSNKSFQEWDYVMNLAGTSMNNMGTGLKTLTNKLDEAKNGSEKSQQMFEALGLSMDELSNMSREDVFSAVIAGFQGMEDSTERAALANDLFGKSGQELTPLFNQTAESTQEVIKSLNEMGGVLSDDAVKASADFQDAMTTMQVAFGGLRNGMLAEFLPSMTMVMDGLGKLASGDDSGLGLIKQGITDFLNNLSNMIPEMLDIGFSIIEALGGALMDNLPEITDSAFKIMDKLLDGLIDHLPEIIEFGIELIGKLIVGLIRAIPKLVKKAPDLIKAIVQGLKNAWPEIQSAGGDIVDGMWKGIQNMWGKLKQNVSKLAGELVDSVKNFFKIGSPSKLFRDEVGQWIPAGIAVGIDGNLDPLEKSMGNIQSTLTPEAIDTTNTIATNYDVSTNNDYSAILSLLSTYLPSLANQQIVLDTGALVGNTVSQYDAALGKLALRGAYT